MRRLLPNKSLQATGATPSVLDGLEIRRSPASSRHHFPRLCLSLDVSRHSRFMKKHTSLIIAVLLGFLLIGCSKHATGPNQVMFDYLGNPVAPPANTDVAYTKEGLASAMQDAAQAANITLTKVEIDDSEFPFLVGVVCAGKGDMAKLKDPDSQDGSLRNILAASVAIPGWL